MGKLAKGSITALYALGALTVLILLGCVIFRVDGTPNPEAMLPMTLGEASSVYLALGFTPMLAASLLFCRAYRFFWKGETRRAVAISLIPAAICLGFAAFWAGVWAVGMVNMFVHFGPQR